MLGHKGILVVNDKSFFFLAVFVLKQNLDNTGKKNILIFCNQMYNLARALKI